MNKHYAAAAKKELPLIAKIFSDGRKMNLGGYDFMLPWFDMADYAQKKLGFKPITKVGGNKVK